MYPCGPQVLFMFLCAFAKLRRETVSFVMSVCLSVRMEQLGSQRADFHESLYSSIFRKFVEKIQVFFFLNLPRIMGSLHEDLCTFIITSHTILLRMRNFSDRSCREKQNAPFMFNNDFLKIATL